MSTNIRKKNINTKVKNHRANCRILLSTNCMKKSGHSLYNLTESVFKEKIKIHILKKNVSNFKKKCSK